MPSLLSEPSPAGVSWRCGTHSHLRRPDAERRSGQPAIATSPSPLRHARTLPLTFFHRPTPSRKARDSTTHGGRRYLHPKILLEGLAMFLQGEVGIAPKMVGQPLLEHRS